MVHHSVPLNNWVLVRVIKHLSAGFRLMGALSCRFLVNIWLMACHFKKQISSLCAKASNHSGTTVTFLHIVPRHEKTLSEDTCILGNLSVFLPPSLSGYKLAWTCAAYRHDLTVFKPRVKCLHVQLEMSSCSAAGENYGRVRMQHAAEVFGLVPITITVCVCVCVCVCVWVSERERERLMSPRPTKSFCCDPLNRCHSSRQEQELTQAVTVVKHQTS